MSDPFNSSAGRTNAFLQRAYKLADASDARILYDEWATAYDKDLNATGYASPQRAVDTVVANISASKSQSSTLTILDAGCGTGLVADYLARSSLAGKFLLDGLDYSPKMLDAARAKGLYRDLETADLNNPIARSSGSYQVVICVGTLTMGHVGAKVFQEFSRVAVKDGIIVATVHGGIWESGGYKAQVEELQQNGVVQIVSTAEFGILEEATTGGRMVVLRKL